MQLERGRGTNQALPDQAVTDARNFGKLPVLVTCYSEPAKTTLSRLGKGIKKCQLKERISLLVPLVKREVGIPCFIYSIDCPGSIPSFFFSNILRREPNSRDTFWGQGYECCAISLLGCTNQ